MESIASIMYLQYQSKSTHYIEKKGYYALYNWITIIDVSTCEQVFAVVVGLGETNFENFIYL